MKTIADFKRALQIGKKVHAINHMTFAGRDEKANAVYTDKDLGVREVSIVQSNSFAFKTVRATGEVVNSWCNYPKSKEIVYNHEKSITIFEEQRNGKMIPILTYTFID